MATKINNRHLSFSGSCKLKSSTRVFLSCVVCNDGMIEPEIMILWTYESPKDAESQHYSLFLSGIPIRRLKARLPIARAILYLSKTHEFGSQCTGERKLAEYAILNILQGVHFEFFRTESKLKSIELKLKGIRTRLRFNRPYDKMSREQIDRRFRPLLKRIL